MGVLLSSAAVMNTTPFVLDARLNLTWPYTTPMDTSRQDKKERNFSNVRPRTRRAMVHAATRLVREGASPSVTEVADAAGGSRATAHPSFPTQESFLAEGIVPGPEA